MYGAVRSQYYYCTSASNRKKNKTTDSHGYQQYYYRSVRTAWLNSPKRFFARVSKDAWRRHNDTAPAISVWQLLLLLNTLVCVYISESISLSEQKTCRTPLCYTRRRTRGKRILASTSPKGQTGAFHTRRLALGDFSNVSRIVWSGGHRKTPRSSRNLFLDAWIMEISLYRGG